MLVKKCIRNSHSSKAKEAINFALGNFSIVHSKYQYNKVLLQKGFANFESIGGYKYRNTKLREYQLPKSNNRYNNYYKQT